ncbi:MAG: T9SS type A sorting domain-containing protein [Maribacter sp.]|nr:T9SS type A sorting domain-containing protein [Maribacter sp.]
MKRIGLLFFLIFSISHAVIGQEIVKKQVNVEKIKVFPNPATTVVNVLGLQNCLNAEILISDGYGNVVQRYRWEIRNNAINIPVASLEQGVYMIIINSPEQSVKTKFYKQ